MSIQGLLKDSPIQTQTIFKDGMTMRRRDLLGKNGFEVTTHPIIVTRIISKKTGKGYTLGASGSPPVLAMLENLNKASKESEYKLVMETKELCNYNKAEEALQQKFFPNCKLTFQIPSAIKQEITGFTVIWLGMIDPNNKDDEKVRIARLAVFSRMLAQLFKLKTDSRLCTVNCHFVGKPTEEEEAPKEEPTTLKLPRARKFA